MSDDLKTKVQELIDSMINPAVAGHGGFVELVDVQDNRVYLQMGGGCQGCGAADITLKSGIERTDQGRAPRGGRGPRHDGPRLRQQPLLPSRQGLAARVVRQGIAMDRLLLLLPTTTYRTEDFLDAARTLGVDIVCASEKPSTFEVHAPDHLLTLDFTDPDGAATKVAELAARRPLRAVVGVDDLTTVAAAAIAERLGLRTNAVAAVTAARDKFQMRQCLAAAGVPIPRFRRIPRRGYRSVPGRARRAVSLRAQAAGAVGQPRRDPRQQRGSVHGRLSAHRRAAGARRRRGQRRRRPVPGRRGVRPRLSRWRWKAARRAARSRRWRCSTSRTRSMGRSSRRRSTSRPRACRPTPGRDRRVAATAPRRRWACARGRCTPSCASTSGAVDSGSRGALDRRSVLADAALRHRYDARGDDPASRTRLAHRDADARAPSRRRHDDSDSARRAGCRRCAGQASAQSVAGVEDVTLTAHVGQELVPLPEGWQYLGFIFARAETPDAVEAALRDAHARLKFEIA